MNIRTMSRNFQVHWGWVCIASGIVGVLVSVHIREPQAQAQGSSRIYSLIDLGTLGGNVSKAYGINDAGQVVGASETPLEVGVYPIHAFLYSGGVMRDLGTLRGSRGYSEARGINASGQIVGSASSSGGELHAFLYDSGVMRDLGTLGGICSYGYGINDSGQIAGWSCTSQRFPIQEIGFLYEHETMTSIGSLRPGENGYSAAYSVNNLGQIVGTSATVAAGVTRPFFFAGGVMRDIGSFPGRPLMPTFGEARDINSLGQIVGTIEDGTFKVQKHAFLFSEGVMHDLGTLGSVQSFAYGINDSGQVVGAAAGVGAFLYSDSVMKDVNTLIDSTRSDFRVNEATAINNLGWIVGSGDRTPKLGNPRNPHALLLIPHVNIPRAPFELRAKVITSSQIDLAWTDQSDTETMFKIERKSPSAGFRQIGTAVAGATTYSDRSVTGASSYLYRVRASNVTGDSPPSNEALASTTASLSALTFDLVTVRRGRNARGTVRLNLPAPRRGAKVTLSSSNPTALTVPASITVPMGKSSAVFSARAKAVPASPLVTVTAEHLGITRTFALTITQ